MEIRSLADQITQAEPTDRIGLVRLHESLKSVRDQIAGEDADIAGRLDAAVVLTRLLSNSSEPVSVQDLHVVASLIQVPGAESAPPSAAGRAATLDEEVPEEEAPQTEASPEPEEASDPLPALKSELRLVCDLTLGDVLLQMKMIGLGQLEDALRLQVRSRDRLGDILVRNGDITKVQLNQALQHQVRMRNETPGAGRGQGWSRDQGGSQPGCRELVTDCLLGEILLRRGTITQEQLDHAIRVQRAAGLRIGEALVDAGAATWGDIDKALELQSLRRRR